MSTLSFSTAFQTDRPVGEMFTKILEVRRWWSGLHSEEIVGHTEKIGDEFTFIAAGGKHWSKQKLMELIPNERIVWLVTESRLTFLDKTDEWNGSKICFDIKESGDRTEVRFTHIGLVPELQCFTGCSSTWPKYLEKLMQPANQEVKTETA